MAFMVLVMRIRVPVYPVNEGTGLYCYANKGTGLSCYANKGTAALGLVGVAEFVEHRYGLVRPIQQHDVVVLYHARPERLRLRRAAHLAPRPQSVHHATDGKSLAGDGP